MKDKLAKLICIKKVKNIEKYYGNKSNLTKAIDKVIDP